MSLLSLSCRGWRALCALAVVSILLLAPRAALAGPQPFCGFLPAAPFFAAYAPDFGAAARAAVGSVAGSAAAAFEVQAGPDLFAMGRGGEDAALAPRNTGADDSVTERLLGGSFLGALLFGYPYDGVGLADIAVLVVLAFLVFRGFAARRLTQGKTDDRYTVNRRDRETTQVPDDYRRFGGKDGDAPDESGRAEQARPRDPENGASANPYDNAWSRRLGGTTRGSENSPWRREGERPPLTVQKRAEAMWAHLSSEQPEEASASEVRIAEGARLPAGFDASDFLEGARALYVKLQTAWAAREVQSLEAFVTPGMLALLQKQADKHPEPVSVDIVLVNAELQGVESFADREEALVRFNVLMRSGGDEEAGEVNEFWRFERGAASNGMWRLACIEAAAA